MNFEKNIELNESIQNEMNTHRNLEKKEIKLDKADLSLDVKLKQLKLNERIEKQRECHEYIKKHEENYEKYEEKFLSALSFILRNAKFKIKHILEFINVSLEYDFIRSLVRILSKSMNSVETLLTKQEETAIKDEKLFIPYVITSMARTFSNYSSKFCILFQESNGILVLSEITKCDKLINNKSQALLTNDAHELLISTIRNCIGSFINFGRVNSNFMQEYRDAKTVESLFVCSNTLKNQQSEIEIACYMALSFIADDDEVIKNASEIKKVIPGIVSIVRKIATNFKEMKGDYIKVKRVKVQLREEDTVESDIACAETAQTVWHLVEVLNGLYHLSVVDSIKSDIYFEHKMAEYLRVFISHGNRVEIENSLILLYQLCFNASIAQDVRKDKLFYDKIDELHASGKNENIKAIAGGIVWILNENLELEKTTEESEGKLRSKEKKEVNEKTISKSSKKRDDGKKLKHIMISYNRESRDLCLKIKSELEKMSYAVWIDVENIHGSSLESMALAIENSMCVLMCMTEKYKQSPNCRAEAEYAFNLHKPIIPLIMQKDFMPNGWLGKSVSMRKLIILKFKILNFH
jgi:hypothetical protein